MSAHTRSSIRTGPAGPRGRRRPPILPAVAAALVLAPGLAAGLLWAPALAAAQEPAAPPSPPSGAREMPPAAPASEDSRARADLLRAWARSYYPGRSGDVFLVPEEGRFVTAEGVPFMHGSPWDYDARVPLILYGPERVVPGRYEAAASHQDVGATLEALLGLPRRLTTTGRVLSEALVGAGESGAEADRRRAAGMDGAGGTPRAIVVLVLDGFRADYLDRYAEETPTLRRMAEGGAWFPNARVSTLPTATSVSHATLVTATEPAVHGITGNLPYDRARGEAANAFQGATAENVLVPTLTDRWAAWTRGRAIVAAQGGTFYPAAALAGHGGCTFGGRPVIMAFFDSRTGGWNTNPDCYRLPGYLIDQNIQTLLAGDEADEAAPEGAAGARRVSDVLPRFEGDATAEILEMEPFGEDDVTDVLLANHKALDFIGHAYGPGSEQMRGAVAEVDRQVARILGLLEERVAAGGFVLVVTSDHGMPEEPGEEGRRLREDLLSEVNARFDPDGGGIVLHYDAADNQLYLDLPRMEELGVGTAEVAAYLEELPYVRAAFTEKEVRRAAAGTPADDSVEPE